MTIPSFAMGFPLYRNRPTPTPVFLALLADGELLRLLRFLLSSHLQFSFL